MSFGHHFHQSTYPLWRDRYIDYDRLKKLLYDQVFLERGAPARGMPDRAAEDFYNELMNVQIARFRDTQADIHMLLQARADACESDLYPLAQEMTDMHEKGKEKAKAVETDGRPHSSTNKDIHDVVTIVSQKLDDISREYNELERYRHLNYTALLKIADKHDRVRGDHMPISTPLLFLLSKLDVFRANYSPMLHRIAFMYAALRHHRHRIQDQSTPQQEDAGSESTIMKLWVHPDNVVEVKTKILRYLPFLIHTPTERHDPSITLVHLDTTTLDFYTAKVTNDRSAPAPCVRLRWTGTLQTSPQTYLECALSTNEHDHARHARFQINSKHISPFLDGDDTIIEPIASINQEISTASAKLITLQQRIAREGLIPTLRIKYNRSVFQIPGDDTVKIALDSNIVFSRESDDSMLEGPQSESRFPYSVLQIRLIGTTQRVWIDDLVASDLVTEVPRFSKYIHGISQLYHVPVNVLPPWLSTMDEGIRRDPLSDARLDQWDTTDDRSTVGSLPGKTVAGLSISPPAAPGPTTSDEARSLAQQICDDHDGPSEIGEARFKSPQRGTTRPWLVSKAVSSFRFRRRRLHYHHADAPLPPGIHKPTTWLKDAEDLKIESKVWLANERTFVKWQTIAVLLASLSLGMYNAANAKGLQPPTAATAGLETPGVSNSSSRLAVVRCMAILYVLVALFAGLWGWYIYLWRSRLIAGRSGRDFDAVAGPVVVCLAVAGLLVVNSVLKIWVAA